MASKRRSTSKQEPEAPEPEAPEDERMTHVVWLALIGAAVCGIGYLGYLAIEERDADRRARHEAKAAPTETAISRAEEALERMRWDIEADDSIPADKKQIVRQGALKVLADEGNCASVVTGGPSGTRPGAYFAMCEPRNGGTVFNVWFTPAEVEGDARLAVMPPFPEGAARELCEKEIRARVKNPSTLNIHRITGYSSRVANNGNRTVFQEFTAKNGFGVEATHQARCLIQPSGEVETTITDPAS